jgi:hypothetical protein
VDYYAKVWLNGTLLGEVRAPDGRELARNTYRDPFHHPRQPQGHPDQMDHEIGMRLWWAAR